MKITKASKKRGQTTKRAMKKKQASRFASASQGDPSVFKEDQKIRFFDLAAELRNKIYTFASHDAEGELVGSRELVRPGAVSQRFRKEYMAQAFRTDHFVADYRLPPTLLPTPSTLPPHTIVSRLTKVVFKINDLQSVNIAQDKSAWQSAFFLMDVRVELGGNAASILCSPANTLLTAGGGELFSLIMKLDRGAIVTYDPPIHPTFYNEWEDQRQQWAAENSRIRGYIERQTATSR
ncbi:hypothetical protein KC333_g6735 [Hortaea werneckii]|nr:hypothetical protein KC333_g6735 [Hortaea werneckii]KAI7310521.1 hypothetical protein KC326_g6638 [Hortaea werneckii]